MPEITLPTHPFDLVFHHCYPALFTALLSGHVHAYTYDDLGNSRQLWSVQPFKKSCRCLDITADGSKIWAGGKGKAIAMVDTTTGQIGDKRLGSHDASINRIKVLADNLYSTGDDDGVIKLWDPRTKEPTQKYSHHFDYITDFLWLDDKKQLVATSGDGTLSVLDVRSKQPKPLAHSEDQEDELLSIVAIKSATKFVVGTQLGVLSIFNRSAGWGDCVDRVPGHPQSVDSLLSVPSSLASSKGATILTGSSDGYVRAVDILPTKLLGVVADHGEFPVERMALGRGGRERINDDDDTSLASSFVTKLRHGSQDSDDTITEGECWWLGSVGHDELLHLTDVGRFFTNLANKHTEDPMGTFTGMGDDAKNSSVDEPPGGQSHDEESESLVAGAMNDDNSDTGTPLMPKKRKRNQKDPLAVKKKIGRNQLNVDDGTFFAEL